LSLKQLYQLPDLLRAQVARDDQAVVGVARERAAQPFPLASL
jgi:hypothetical protein